MSNEITKINQMPVTEIMSIGKAFVESGMFPDTKTAAQAVVKIQAGQEIGIPPFAAMTGIHIIQGRPTVGAGLIASKVKSSGKYNYKVIENTERKCSIDFYEGKEMIGNSTFTIEDAKKAGTKNIDRFPKNMLFARAISNGVKWFTPDVFNGPVYTPEEMNVEQKTEDAQPDTYSVVNEPSDVTAEDDFLQSWKDELQKCSKPTELVQLYKGNAPTVEADPRLKKMFKQREAEIKQTV